MQEQISDRLRVIHRTNRVLWLSVLSGMVVLVLVTYILKQNELFSQSEILISNRAENLFLLLVVGLLFFVFYLKRHYLQATELVQRALTREVNLASSDIADLAQVPSDEADALARVLILMRRYFMLVWSTANIILLVGFVTYLLANQFQTFMIYAVVSFYSMSINFPSFRLIESCREMINAWDG